MIKLAERPPRCVEFAGQHIKLRPWVKNVLQMQEVLNDPIFLDSEKIDISLWLLVRHRFFLRFLSKKQRGELLEKIIKQIIAPEQKQGKKVMDFVQDAGAIYSAFLQVYHIDLYKQKMHWWIFLELLRALPEDTRLAQIINIRSQPIPQATKYNAAERARLMQLKAEYALKPDSAAKNTSKEEGFKKMAQMMLAMAETR